MLTRFYMMHQKVSRQLLSVSSSILIIDRLWTFLHWHIFLKNLQ